MISSLPIKLFKILIEVNLTLTQPILALQWLSITVLINRFHVINYII